MKPEPAAQQVAATAALQKQLDQFVENNPDILGCAVSTVDGFEVAASMKRPMSAAKLAAMTSSLLALAEAISSESEMGASKDLVIDAEKGRLLLMEIPTAGSRLLLTALCHNSATLGQVLWPVKALRNELQGISLD